METTKNMQAFTVYLDSFGHLVAWCAECGDTQDLDDAEPDKDTGEFLCTSCLEKLEREARENEAYLHAEYQRMVGF